MNIRKTLLEMDKATFNKYDLTHLYESCDLSDKDKQIVVDMLNKHEDAEVIYDNLKKYLSHDNIADDIDSITEDYDSKYTKVSSKTVMDSDGFYTDYTWYRDEDGNNVFVFGDSDIYKPEDGDFDFETESNAVAVEWFDDYRGFEDENDELIEKCKTLKEELPKEHLTIKLSGDTNVFVDERSVTDIYEIREAFLSEFGNIFINNNKQLQDKLMSEVIRVTERIIPEATLELETIDVIDGYALIDMEVGFVEDKAFEKLTEELSNIIFNWYEGDHLTMEFDINECEINYNDLEEDTVKTRKGKWVNKGKAGTHGTFNTKKEADAQRKAMFASGYKNESLEGEDGWSEDITEITEPFFVEVENAAYELRNTVRGASGFGKTVEDLAELFRGFSDMADDIAERLDDEEETLTESSYGGAYDITDDSTKKQLIKQAEKISNDIIKDAWISDQFVKNKGTRIVLNIPIAKDIDSARATEAENRAMKIYDTNDVWWDDFVLQVDVTDWFEDNKVEESATDPKKYVKAFLKDFNIPKENVRIKKGPYETYAYRIPKDCFGLYITLDDNTVELQNHGLDSVKERYHIDSYETVTTRYFGDRVADQKLLVNIKEASGQQVTESKFIRESIEIETIGDYITDHYDFDDVDDKYSCINSIRDSFKGQNTISKEELEQFIGSHNGKDKIEESVGTVTRYKVEYYTGDSDERLETYIYADSTEEVRKQLVDEIKSEGIDDIVITAMIPEEVPASYKDYDLKEASYGGATTNDFAEVEQEVLAKLNGGENHKEAKWERLITKLVNDSDGFTTDYSMWYNKGEKRWVFIFGDSDVYDPTNTDPDWETEDPEEARQWFLDYNGFEDTDESLKEDWRTGTFTKDDLTSYRAEMKKRIEGVVFSIKGMKEKHPEYSEIFDNLTDELVDSMSSLKNESLDEDTEEDELETADQKISSAATSINSNKLPAIFRMVKFQPDTMNLDYGGGRFDNAAEELAKINVTNLVYDPYNRSAEHNQEVLKQVRANGGADTVTISNVLNVIAEPEARQTVLRNAKKLVKPGGKVYITVYEGNKSGSGAETKAGYQLNKDTKDYVDEISQVFDNVTRKGKLIIAE